jgi:anti-sigma-K factor RskA
MAAPWLGRLAGVHVAMTSDQSSDDKGLIAAEFALGLLTGDDQVDAQRLAATDPDFVQSVVDWEIRLAAMTNILVWEEPNPALKKAIFSDLFPDAKRTPLWQRLWVWQVTVAFSLFALVGVLAFDPTRPAQTNGPLYTAEIVAVAGDFRVVAVVDKSTNQVFLTRTAGAAPEGRILQVWAHGEGEPAISVGLWSAGDTISLPMPQTISAVQGVLTLGVSEEPPGGSTTGSPSGRVFGTIDIQNVSATF